MTFRQYVGIGIASSLAIIASRPICADVPTDDAARAKIVGKPSALSAQPAKITLVGPRAMQQVVVTGEYAGSPDRDLTPFVTFKTGDPSVAIVSQGGMITPRHDGITSLIIQAGTQKTTIPIVVEHFDKPQPVSFRREVMATLNVGGCNSGSCHGTPNGKNGFKLSLRGFDPDADFLQLRRDLLGRRSSTIEADGSLILLKALGKIAHEGGTRFVHDSVHAHTMRSWLAEGGKNDPLIETHIKKLEVLPGPRILHAPSRWQQLAVIAHFADETVRDVTRFTVFSSSDPEIAQVQGAGLVEFGQSGEVAILCRYLQTIQTVNLTFLEPRPGFVWKNLPENNDIDRHVFAKLKMMNIQPSELCSDHEFVRRAYLDLCAVLPTPLETRKFLADADKNKRVKLIETLLERPEFLDFWTMKWMDVLRGSQRILQPKGAQAYQKWFREHLQKNTPFDQVVRELLTATGSTFEVGPANFYRAVRNPEEIAETTAQLFFGIRMQCSKCHNHPFERWTQDDYYSLAAFFSKVSHKGAGKEPFKNKGSETIYLDPKGEVKHLRTGRPAFPRFLGGADLVFVPKEKDRRATLADWATSKSNPFFARSVVNRTWYHLLGRGIVDPVDDFRDSNPPANAALLDALARDFVEHDFDVKHLIRTIMASRTYQLSALGNDFNKTDTKYFSHTITRLLSAEQLLDALSQVTEVPEKFPGFVEGTRAVNLAGADIEHPFLKSFGKPSRDTVCECEREGETNLGQALQFISGSTINGKLTSTKNRLSRLLTKKLGSQEMAEELYLATLSRLPSATEVRAAVQHVENADSRRAGWEDVQWTLLNTKEFMFRH
jgi:hypothetical protein